MKLTEENFEVVAMKHYDNSQLNTYDEFRSDLNRIHCAQKLIERYMNSDTKTINIRLLVNHCIVLHNSFGYIVGEMFKVRFPPHYQAVIRPVLQFLKIVKTEDWNDIEFDRDIHNKLIDMDKN